MNDTELQLLVGDQLFGGWTSIDVRLGVERMANTFDLGLVDKTADFIGDRPIRRGQACTVRIGKQTLITGYVDDDEAGYDAEGYRMGARGRDRTGDLVDCSADWQSGEWSDQTLLQVAQNLCAPFSVKVTDTSGVTTKLPTWQIQPGETVAENLQRAARVIGVLLIADGKGGLRIAKASRQRIATPLQGGVNIVAPSARRSFLDRFSHYQIVGQQPMSGTTGYNENATEVSGTASDAAIGRHRPLKVVADDNLTPEMSQQRADWEKRVRAGRSLQVSITVADWWHADGLWLPDRIVAVRDDVIDVDQDLYISDVQYLLDESGRRAVLSLTLPEAFDVIPIPDSSVI
ncbi:phage baseplate assembly protein [Hydrocarboniphaga effusa]|uniref:phage baseplate assembly protein n=1 Tax=Hydrocarboniphaga effusa TaxID=243629 RepID=UPI003BA89AC9